MKRLFRLIEVVFGVPFYIAGFVWVHICCAFYLGRQDGNRWGIYVNTPKERHHD